MTPNLNPSRTQDPDTGQFLTNDEIATRTQGQQTRQNVARATRERRPAPNAHDEVLAARLDEYTLPDSEFDNDLDAEPGTFELPQERSRPRPSGAPPENESAGETPVSGQPAGGAQRRPQSRHPSGLTKWGKDLGFEPAEMEGYDTDQLTNVLRRVDSERSARRQTYSEPGQNGTPAPERRPAQPETPAPAAPPSKAGFKLPDDIRASLGEDFAAALEKSIPQFVDEHTKDLREQNAALVKRLEATEGVVRDREYDSLSQRIDGAFKELGQDWESVLGKGPLSGVAAQPSARRQQIVDIAVKMQKARGGQVTDHIAAAAQHLFGDFIKPRQQQEPQRRQAAPKRRLLPQAPLDLDLEDNEQNGDLEWDRGGLLPTTSRSGGGSEPKGRNRAIRAVTQQMAENRRPIHEQFGDEEDTIPD